MIRGLDTVDTYPRPLFVSVSDSGSVQRPSPFIRLFLFVLKTIHKHLILYYTTLYHIIYHIISYHDVVWYSEYDV